MKIKLFKPQGLCWQTGLASKLKKSSKQMFAFEYCTVVQVTTSPHDGTCLVCWQASDSVFISQCCLQQDQTVTHSYKLWWYMAPIIPHLDITKHWLANKTKADPAPSSCGVSIRMTDWGLSPMFPNITPWISPSPFRLKNFAIMDLL